MKKEIKLGVSPITKTIYAGTLIKNNTMWGANKQDVTESVFSAMCEFLHKHRETRTFAIEGKTYKIDLVKVEE